MPRLCRLRLRRWVLRLPWSIRNVLSTRGPFPLPPPISLFVLSLSVLVSLSLYLSLCVCLSLPPSSVSLERSTTIISAAETRQSTKLKSNWQRKHERYAATKTITGCLLMSLETCLSLYLCLYLPRPLRVSLSFRQSVTRLFSQLIRKPHNLLFQ